MKSLILVVITIAVVIIGIGYQRYFLTESLEERRAWLTLLANDDYLPGALALARSLKRAKSIYPLVVLVVPELVSEESRQVLLNEGCSLRSVKGIYLSDDRVNLVFSYNSHAWTKLRAFEMVDICQKCVFMDADMIVLQNMDELFEIKDDPNFAAVQTCICNPKRTSSFPEYWKPANCPYTHEEHSPDETIVDERGRVFNSGLFVLRPNLTIFDRMIVALDTWDLTDFKFADQNFLNKFYASKWYRLPYIYNSLKTFSESHPYMWDESKIKAIHYIHGKPWNASDERNSGYEQVNQLWQQAYEWRADMK